MPSASETIQAETSAIEGLVPQLEDARMQFVEASITYAQDWVRVESRRAVSEHADAVSTLTNEQLAEVKTAVAALTAGVPERLRDSYADDLIWPHASPVDLPSRTNSQSSLHWREVHTSGERVYGDFPAGVVEPLHQVFTELGRLLRQRGVIDPSHGEVPWQRSSAGADSSIEFSGSLRPSLSLAQASNQYEKLWADFFNHHATLQVADKMLASENAVSRWDDA